MQSIDAKGCTKRLSKMIDQPDQCNYPMPHWQLGIGNSTHHIMHARCTKTNHSDSGSVTFGLVTAPERAGGSAPGAFDVLSRDWSSSVSRAAAGQRTNIPAL